MCQGHVSPSGGRRRASIFNGISVQMFPPTSKRKQPNKNGGRGQRKEWVSYGRRSILFHPYAERIKELHCYTSKDDGKGLNRSKRTKRGNILGRYVMKSKSEPDLVQDVKETLRKLKRVNIKIDPAMSSFGVKEGSKFIPKLAELKHPLREARTRMETTKGSGWINEAKEAFRRIKMKLGKLPTLAIPKEGEDQMLCLRQRDSKRIWQKAYDERS
ncbi:hypothetical protein Tco_1161681 [Tanacetum coccineum]